ncbi:serine hydrolase FSH [Aspergillus recurvatus]
MSDPTLHLSRILCLHGGGVTAEVFRLQSRTLIKQLQPHFRLCFADGPFLSEPGPGMIPTYQHYAPFHEIIDELDRSIEAAIAADDAKGATGDWVGLMGFSQGGKVSASILYRQQIRAEKLSPEQAGSQFCFAVLLAARPLLVSLDTELPTSPALAEASDITTSGFQNYQVPERRISRPTVHVHGLRDPGLPLHRKLLEQWCEKGTVRAVEFYGDHRVPVREKDVALVVNQIIHVAKQTGALRPNRLFLFSYN